MDISQLYPRHAESITPHDTNEVDVIGLYVGGAGDIVARLADDTANATFVGVPAGALLPFHFKLILSTGTTATNMVGVKVRGF